MRKTTTRRQAPVLSPLDVRHRSREKRSGCSMTLIPAVAVLVLVATRLLRSAP